MGPDISPKNSSQEYPNREQKGLQVSEMDKAEIRCIFVTKFGKEGFVSFYVNS